MANQNSVSLRKALAVAHSHFFHVTEETNHDSIKTNGLSPTVAKTRSLDENQYSSYQVGNRPVHCLCTEKALDDIVGMCANARTDENLSPVSLLIFRIPASAVLCRDFDLDRSHGNLRAEIQNAIGDPLGPVPEDCFLYLLCRHGCLALFEDVLPRELELYKRVKV